MMILLSEFHSACSWFPSYHRNSKFCCCSFKLIFLLLERENGPRTVKDVKLISAGRILENNKTVGECRSPLCDIPGGVTTMHVVVQPPPPEQGKIILLSILYTIFVADV